MPISAPNGGQPKAGAPAYFQFADYVQLGLVNAFAKYDIVAFFGLPTGPQTTATF